MSMNYLTIPSSGVKVFDGDVVMLYRYPGKKWILQDGWYVYNAQQVKGWHFYSIPDGIILPITDSDLQTLSVLSSGCDKHHNSHRPAHPTPPGPPATPEIPSHITYELDRAFITVDTIAQRDQLNKRLLPHGKIVCVNNAGDGIKYFRWNQIDQEWVITDIIDEEKYLTRQEAAEAYASNEQLDEISRAVQWGSISSDI